MSNLKPFNLERALAGDPVVTRGGRPATQIQCFESQDNYCLYAVIDGYINSFTKQGKHSIHSDAFVDLFMAPKEVEYWVATGDVPAKSNGLDVEFSTKWASLAYRSEDSAISYALAKNIKNIRTHKIIRYE